MDVQSDHDMVNHLVEQVLAGDPRGIARAISVVEDEGAAAAELIRRIHGSTGKAFVIGVTGPPGAGKSTLVDGLAGEIRRSDLTVGVIAVDPTSPFTGGAVLGDRVRMGSHAADRGVFIRSMATRGHLGGLARAASDAAAVLDAAGSDVIVIETVGVGQDEIDIVRIADVSVVVLVPGTGDEVQALKAGLMEIADIFVVNKADREGADRLAQIIAAQVGLNAAEPAAWTPPILKTEATRGTGLPELWSAVGEFRSHRPDTLHARRRARDEFRLRELLARLFLQRVTQSLPEGELDRVVDRVTAREIDPYSAAAALIDRALQPSPSLVPAAPSDRAEAKRSEAR